MTPQINQWSEAFKATSTLFHNTFNGLSSAELNWKLNEKSWSIGQIVDHVIKLNESYYPILDALSAGKYKTPFMAKIGFVPRYFGQFLIKSLEPSRKKKVSTFPIWEPAESNVSEDIISQFTTHHDTLIKKLEYCSDLFGKGVVISSPANKYVVYSLDTAIDILIVHEHRHYNQALEVLAFQKGTQF
jgi:hypothetical protein